MVRVRRAPAGTTPAAGHGRDSTLSRPVARVLALTNLYPPHHLGGYELSCRDVMDRLADEGHEIVVLTSTHRSAGVVGDEVHAGVEVRRELEWWWSDHELLSPPLRTRLRWETANQSRLRALLRELQPDVVSVWNMGAMSLGLLATVAAARIPAVMNICDDWLLYGPRLDAWSRLFGPTRARRAAGRAVTAVTRLPTTLPDQPWPGAYLFVSAATRAAARAGTGWDPPRSAVVGSGIDHRDFPVADSPPEDRPWSGRLLYVGRVEARKGVEPLVRALALVPETSLTVLGPVEPAYRPTVERLLDECGVRDRVTFDEVPRSELANRYRSADAVVFPSLWSEPFGLVPIEAMACDTPVVASGTGGSAEFLADERNCLVAPPGDPSAIAAAVGRLAADPALRRRLVDAGRDTARWADVDDLARLVGAWHAHAASGFSGPRPPDRLPPTADPAR